MWAADAAAVAADDDDVDAVVEDDVAVGVGMFRQQ